MDPFARLCEHLSRSRRVLLFTGAGISTGSGIPDFRGPGGVWTRRQPVYFQDFLRSEEARLEHWDYKLEGWPAFREARPNPAHFAAVRIEKAGRLEALVTQNIDGLHEKAGTSPDLLVELHGTNRWIECLDCGERSDPEPHFAAFARTRQIPRCACGGLLKPATISFGQNLRPEALERAAEAAARADLVLALGSSLAVYPAAGIPLEAAQRGVPYIIINRGPTEQDGLPEVSLRLEGDVVQIFPPAVEVAFANFA